jgi:glycerol-3-phosphate dehydrogenase
MYLISAINNMFQDLTISSKDVQSYSSGLRPLIHQDGKSTSELFRKEAVFIPHSELIFIAGKKLAGY